MVLDGGLGCNRCGKEIDDGAQVLTTSCMHCFCLECANNICEGDNTCSVCGAKLDAENVSVEICRNSDSDIFSLRGASPADVIMVVSDALVFNETQRHIAMQVHTKAHKDKHKGLVESSKAKLAQMHEAYKKLVAKVKTFAQEKADGAQLLEELRSKAQDHSRICRKLQEQLKSSQQKSMVMRQQIGQTAGVSPNSSGAGRLPSLKPPSHHRSQTHSQRHALIPITGAAHPGNSQHHYDTSRSGKQSGLSQIHTARPKLHCSRQAGGGVAATSPTFMGHGGSPSDLNVSSVSAPSGASGLSGMLCEAGLNGVATGKHVTTEHPFHKRRRTSSGSHGSLTDLIKSRRK